MTTKRARKPKAPATPTTKAGSSFEWRQLATRISADKHRELKLQAIKQERTVMAILDEALGEWLEKAKKGAS